MTCRQFTSHLAHLTSEQIAKRLNNEAEGHLAGCAACRDFRRTYHQTLSLASRLAEDSLPEGMFARFMRAAQGTEQTATAC